MERISVAAARAPQTIGQQVQVQGWIRTRRDSKGGFSFLEVNDGSCMANLQIVAEAALPNYESEVKKLSAGCSVSVEGEVKESAGNFFDGLLDAWRSARVGLIHETEHRVELLWFETEGRRQRLHDLWRGPVVPTFDLAQIRIGHPRHLGEIPQRDVRQLTLRANEFAEGDEHRIFIGCCHDVVNTAELGE